MRTAILSSIVLGFVAVGCTSSASNDGAASASQADVSDVLSIIKRADGNFDVTCHDKTGGPDYNETRTADQLSAVDICEHPPTTAQLVQVDNVSASNWISSGTLTPASWSTELWNGYVSFEVAPTGNCQVTVVDGTGATFAVSADSRFDRLQMPAKVNVGGYQCSFSAQVTNIKLEVTSTTSESFHGKYTNDDQAHGLHVLGADISGATLTFNARGHFYKNFTDGAACSTLQLVDKTGKKVTLNAATSGVATSLVAPVSVSEQSACMSTRLATPENATDDYAVTFSDFVVDNR